jgi:hypothetical protein
MESAEACTPRSPIQTVEKLMSRAHMQLGESSRRHEKLAREERAEPGQKGPGPTGLGRFQPGSGSPLT